jgi:hypothetical protein
LLFIAGEAAFYDDSAWHHGRPVWFGILRRTQNSTTQWRGANIHERTMNKPVFEKASISAQVRGRQKIVFLAHDQAQISTALQLAIKSRGSSPFPLRDCTRGYFESARGSEYRG